MMSGSEWWRAIVGAVVGFLYGSALALWSLVLFGSGHATSIPLLLSSAPLSVVALAGKLVDEPYVGYAYKATLLGAPLVWAAFGSFLALSPRGKRLRLAQVLVVLHYASGLALVETMGEGLARLQTLPGIHIDIAMWAMVYLAGQIALWASMWAGSEPRRAIVAATVGLSYGSVLAFLSVGAVGGGHGTIVPLLLSSAPFFGFFLVAKSLGASSYLGEAIFNAMLFGAPLIWAALGWLVTLSGRGKSLRLARILVLLQFTSGLEFVAIILPDAWNVSFPHGWDVIVLLIVWATLYLLGQVAMWWRLSRRNKPTS